MFHGALTAIGRSNPGFAALWRVEQRCEFPEPGLVQAEKDLMQRNSFRAFARTFQHKVRAILAQQIGRMVNQVAGALETDSVG